MISQRSFCENDVSIVQCTGVMTQKFSKHDGNWFPTCNIIILIFQIIYLSLKALIVLFNNANEQ